MIWPKEYFYYGALTFTFGRLGYTRLFHLWVIDMCIESYSKHTRPQSNIFISVKGGYGELRGRSFINSANARFVVEFVANHIH